MDVPFLHPILESVVAHAQLVRQVADPPLVRSERFRRPASGTETESIDQLSGARWGESVFAVRDWKEALPVEALGDLFGCLTSRDSGLDQGLHPRRIA